MTRTPPEIRREMIGIRKSIRRSGERLTKASRAVDRGRYRRSSRRILDGLETRYLEAKSEIDALKREARILERELCTGWEPKSWSIDGG